MECFTLQRRENLNSSSVWAVMESVTSSNPCLLAKLVVLLWVWNESLTPQNNEKHKESSVVVLDTALPTLF